MIPCIASYLPGEGGVVGFFFCFLFVCLETVGGGHNVDLSPSVSSTSTSIPLR